MIDRDLLNYKVSGNGHPVVFLHGFLESSAMWDYMNLKKADFQCIFIDLPGHGKSKLSDDTDAPTLGYMAEKVKEVLDEMCIEMYHVIGHSMGGYVGLILKEIDPRCKKVILMNSNFWEDSEDKKKDRIRVADFALTSKDLFINEGVPGLFYRNKRTDMPIVDLIHEAKKMEGHAIAYASLAMRTRKNKFNLIREFNSDFLIIHGSFDPLVSVEKLKSELRNVSVQLKILSESGHMSHIEQSNETLEAIIDFIKY